MVSILAFLLSAFLQIPAAESALSARPVVDNERVTVRTGTVVPGQAPAGDAGSDSVTIYLSGGSVRTSKGTVVHKAGDVVYNEAGGSREQVGDSLVRAMIITLHEAAVPAQANTSGYPEAFPRKGSRKILENDRVVVWDYTFTPGQPSPMHFHSRDTVVLYTEDGAVTSTTPEGVKTVVEHPPGHITFNARNRAHTEVVTRGAVHIIVTELK